MRFKSLFRNLVIWTLGLFAGLSPLAFAEAVSPQEQIQVQASRVTSSLMLLRGEGFQKKHQEALEADLQALAGAVQSLPQGSDALRSAHQELVVQIRRGVAFGPGEEDMPWRYPEELSKALLGVLDETRKLAAAGDSELAAKLEYLSVQYLSRSYFGNFEIAREQTDTYLGQDERKLVPAVDSELAAKLEYLSVQYLSRSYFGNFEISREQTDTYLGQDERKLVPAVDSELAAIDPKAHAELGKLKTRWEYLKAALNDLNSQSSALQSASGRPFAPITVYRHTRSFTEQWMAMF